MYAVVETSGKQYKVQEGDELLVDLMDATEGSTVELDRVLLLSDKDVKVGTPTVAGAKVTAEVIAHSQGEKRVTYRYNRRHRTRRLKGFRPDHTTLLIKSIKG